MIIRLRIPGAVLLGLLLVGLGTAYAGTIGRPGVLVALAAYWASLGWAGARAARWLVGGIDAPSRLTAGLTATIGLAVTPAVILGHFGQLSPRNALFAAAAILLASQAIPLTPRGRSGVSRESSVPDRAAMPACLPVVARRTLLVSVVTVAIALGLGVRSARYLPPGTDRYDDISYHLTAAAEWYRHGDLRMVKPGTGDQRPPYYPIVAELTTWANLALLEGSDFVARFTELPFALGCLVAAAAIARALGMGGTGSAVAVLLLTTNPRLLPKLMLGAGADGTVAFFTLASVHAILLFARAPRARRAVYLGWAAGLLLGTKYTALIFLPPLVALACVACLATPATGSRSRPPGFGAVLAHLLLLAVLAVPVGFLAGGYTYLRNAITTGNPVYPVQVTVAGHTLLEGWRSQTPENVRRVARSSPIAPWEFLWRRQNLFGPLFRWTLLPAALLAPGIALLLPFSRHRRRARGGAECEDATASEVVRTRPAWRERLLVANVWILPAVFYLGFVGLMPDHRDVRFIIAAIGIAAVACAWLLESTPAGLRSIGAVAVALAVPSIVASHLDLDIPAPAAALPPLVALALGLARLRRRVPPPHSTRSRPDRDRRVRASAGAWRRIVSRPLTTYGSPFLLLAGILAVALGLTGTSRKYDERRLRGDPGAAYMESQTGSAPAVVGYTGSNQPYLYFGTGLQNQVLYVPTHDVEGAWYYDWGGSTVRPRAVRDRRAWYRNLARVGVSYLVIRTVGHEQPELRWIEELPCCRELVWHDTGRRIYSLQPPELRAYLDGLDERPKKRPRRRSKRSRSAGTATPLPPPAS